MKSEKEFNLVELLEEFLTDKITREDFEKSINLELGKRCSQSYNDGFNEGFDHGAGNY